MIGGFGVQGIAVASRNFHNILDDTVLSRHWMVKWVVIIRICVSSFYGTKRELAPSTVGDPRRNCAEPVPGLLVRASLEGVVLAVRFALESIFKSFDNVVLTRNVIGVWCEKNFDVSGPTF